jgi:NitT/TauT family transport system permease protein
VYDLDDQPRAVDVAPPLIEAPTVRPTVVGSRWKRFAALVLPPLVLFGVVIGFWYFAHYFLLSEHRKFVLPYPHDVVRVGFLEWDNLSELLEAAWSSTRVAAIGLAIAIVLGVSIAVLMSQAKLIERAVFPLLVAVQGIPILAIVPLITFLLGTNQSARVFVCVLISFFPIVLNTLFGLLSADPGLHDLVTLHRAARWTRLRKVMFPAALPAMFAGLRISAGLSVVGAIVGDFFFGRGDVGIGQRLKQYAANSNYNNQLYAAVIVAAMMGIIVFLTFSTLQNVAVGKWHDSKSGGGR